MSIVNKANVTKSISPYELSASMVTLTPLANKIDYHNKNLVITIVKVIIGNKLLAKHKDNFTSGFIQAKI